MCEKPQEWPCMSCGSPVRESAVEPGFYVHCNSDNSWCDWDGWMSSVARENAVRRGRIACPEGLTFDDLHDPQATQGYLIQTLERVSTT